MTGDKVGWIDVVKSTKVYKQSNIVNTPLRQNANNVLGAVQHFSHKFDLYRTENPQGLINDYQDYRYGHYVKGQGTKYEITCEVQRKLPIDSTGTIKLIEGEYDESALMTFPDPYHPDHIDLYGEPFYIRSSDSRYKAGERNGDGVNTDEKGSHADLIFWLGQWWVCREVIPFPSSSFEEEQGDKGGYWAGVWKLYADHNHERYAGKLNEQGFASDGELL